MYLPELPGSRLFTLTLALLGALLCSPAASADDEVTLRAVPLFSQVYPGEQLPVAIIIEHAEGFHTWPAQDVLPKEIADFAIRTQLKPASENSALRFGPVQFPEPHPGKVANPSGESPAILTVPLYSGRAVAFVPVIIDASAKPGTLSIDVSFKLQACNESYCLRQQVDTLTIPLTVIAQGSQRTATVEAGLFTAFDAGVFSRMLGKGNDPSGPSAASSSPPQEFDFLGYKFSLAADNYALILLIAFVAGLLMNFTPCVLPVIPIKVLSLQQHAGSAHKLVFYGLIYCLGIIALYGILGLMAFGIITGGQKFDWGQIFTKPWFTIPIAALVGVMGLGMMGLFSIRLPNFIYQFSPTGDSAASNFLIGLLTGVLAVPCTGPLLGATLAWTVLQPKWLGLTTFLVMGVGMASPYAVLIAFPRLINRVPRGGPGGELLKQVLGLLMVAVAIYLGSTLTSAKWTWYVVGAGAVFAAIWWMVGAWRMLRTPAAKWSNSVLAALLLLASVTATRSLADEGPIPWRTFSSSSNDSIRATVAEAVKSGKVVVIDFTAKWCVNCHVIEREVLKSETGLEILNRKSVVPMQVDLTTADDATGWGVVKDISGAGGIPLIAVYGPAISKPVYFQSFFKPSDLAAAVTQAAGSK